MINLNLTPDELLMLLGVKEAQFYQQSKQVELLSKQNANLEHKVSALMNDRDMDQIELSDLRGKITRITMMTEKV